jgi:hypothetical protein
VRAQLAGDDHFAEQPPTAVAIWDRLLSYGAAMGVAPGAVRPIPMGTESDTEAWTAFVGSVDESHTEARTDFGGGWRAVQVRYPLRILTGWGRRPAVAIALGLLFLLPAVIVPGAIGDLSGESDGVGRAIGFLVFVIGPLLAFVYGARLVWRGVADVGKRVTLDGEVLRRKAVKSNNGGTVAVYLAVYDGNGSEVRALLCKPAVASDVNTGDLVRATISPHLAYVYRVERLGPMVSIQTGS